MIRRLKPSDKTMICVLSDQISQDHHDNMPADYRKPAESGRDWEHWLTFDNDEFGIFLVAEVEGEVVGFIACRVIESGKASFLVPKTKLQIATIVVEQAAQRQGIGRELINSAFAAGKSLGATEAFLEVMSYNITAQKFYEGLGFDDFSRKLSRQLK